MAEAPEADPGVIPSELDTPPEVNAIAELDLECAVPRAKEILKNQWSVCSSAPVQVVQEASVAQEGQVEHLAVVARMDQSAKEPDREVQAVLAVHPAAVHVDQGYDDVQVVSHQEVHRMVVFSEVSLERILQRQVEQRPSCYVSPEVA